MFFLHIRTQPGIDRRLTPRQEVVCNLRSFRLRRRDAGEHLPRRKASRARALLAVCLFLLIYKLAVWLGGTAAFYVLARPAVQIKEENHRPANRWLMSTVTSDGGAQTFTGSWS